MIQRQQQTANKLAQHSRSQPQLSILTTTASYHSAENGGEDDDLDDLFSGTSPPSPLPPLSRSALSDKKKKRLAAEAEAREIEASPYGVKRSKRLVASKMELESDVYTQQIKIAKTLYDADIEFDAPAPDNGTWRVTDAYFDNAKALYDSIIRPFNAPPKVYKLEAMRVKLQAQAEAAPKGGRGARGVRGGVKRAETQEDESSALSPSRPIDSTSSTAGLALDEEELGTMLDPFDVPKPWVMRYENDGSVYYYNTSTKAKRSDRPPHVWKEKLNRLELLVPRDDASGWDYKETEAEQRARIRVLLMFEKKILVDYMRYACFVHMWLYVSNYMLMYVCIG
jgi:hypothetical protein